MVMHDAWCMMHGDGCINRQHPDDGVTCMIRAMLYGVGVRYDACCKPPHPSAPSVLQQPPSVCYDPATCHNTQLKPRISPDRQWRPRSNRRHAAPPPWGTRFGENQLFYLRVDLVHSWVRPEHWRARNRNPATFENHVFLN